MRHTATVLLFLAMLAPTAGVQDETRQIWDTAFRQQRPPAPAASTGPKPTPDVVYRPEGRLSASTTASGVVGFTVWRLRGANAADTGARLLVPVSPGKPPSESVAERLRASDRLRKDDQVRLGIEVPRRGYLYIVNREVFADGRRGDPFLIFPSKTLRNGDNRVVPGRLIEIPAQTDEAPALRVQKKAGHVGEELVVIVSDEPLAGVIAGDRETALSSDLVRQWEQRWGASPTERLDLVSQPRALWTEVEKSAGGTERLLMQADPMPAALYRAERVGGVLLVRIQIGVE